MIYRKDAKDLRKGRKEFNYKLLTTLLTPFLNNTVLKFINKPNLQLLNFKYVNICAKCKSFSASTDFI